MTFLDDMEEESENGNFLCMKGCQEIYVKLKFIRITCV